MRRQRSIKVCIKQAPWLTTHTLHLLDMGKLEPEIAELCQFLKAQGLYEFCYNSSILKMKDLSKFSLPQLNGYQVIPCIHNIHVYATWMHHLLLVSNWLACQSMVLIPCIKWLHLSDYIICSSVLLLRQYHLQFLQNVILRCGLPPHCLAIFLDPCHSGTGNSYQVDDLRNLLK